MGTLASHTFDYEPDMGIIQQQCDRAIRGDPSKASRFSKAVKNLKEAREAIDRGDIEKAFAKLSDPAVSGILDEGADELDAGFYYYMGLIVLTVGDTKNGMSLLASASHKTQDPRLALFIYNRMTIAHLGAGNYDDVMLLVHATRKAELELPKSDFRTYFSSAASYSEAEACFRKDDYPHVLAPVQDALAGFQSLSMQSEAAKCQGLLGNALIMTGEVNRGLEQIEKSLETFRRQKNDGEVSFLLQGRGLAMAQLGRKNEAIKDLREALKLFKNMGETKAVNTTLALIAKLESF